MTNLEWAFKYASIGWKVFPVWWINNGTCACGKCIDDKFKGKHPIPTHGHNDATTDTAIITKWWTEYPNANIAVRTGKESGITVLDIDERHGGFDSLKMFDDIEPTVEAKSGSGSCHLFMEYDPTVKSRNGYLAPGLDTKNDGGYIILTPSNHISGGYYEWITDQSPFEYKMIKVPSWMKASRTEKPVSTSEPAIIPAGNRNSTLCSLAGTMHRRHMSKDAILAALLTHNKEYCSPPMSEDEVRNIVNSIGKYDRPALEIGTMSQIWTDVFNAELLVNFFKGKMVWCDKLGGWLIWNGAKWETCEKEEPLAAAITTFQKLIEMIPAVNNKRFTSHATSAGNASKLNAMLNISKAHLAKSSCEFDKDDNLFNCQSGTINLFEMSFNSHNPNDNITKMAEVFFDKSAIAPTWEIFINDIFMGDKELISFVQKAVGYSLSGDTSEQCLFICYGIGKNGKSTFLEIIREVIGDYAGHIRSEAFMDKKGSSIPNDIAAIRGKRFVTVVETAATNKLDESMVKQVTGNEVIQARFLNKEFFTFKPTFKIWMATNNKPRIDGSDDGIWRRIRLVPFKYQVPDNKVDKKLFEKLQLEKTGILNWALTGFRRYKEEGLIPPSAVSDFTKEYREDEDVIGSFISEMCIKSENGSVEKRMFKDQLQLWSGRRFSDRIIKQYMVDKHNYQISMPGLADRKRHYIGICMLFKESNRTEENVDWSE